MKHVSPEMVSAKGHERWEKDERLKAPLDFETEKRSM